MRRKGEDTFAMKRRRMPYVAKIKRATTRSGRLIGARSKRW